MSKIDTLIKELQTKKKKIDYLNYVLDVVKNDKHCVDFTDVKDEVFGLIEPRLKELISAIENDLPTDLQPAKTSQDFTEHEQKVLKQVAKAASQKLTSNEPAQPAKPNQVFSNPNQVTPKKQVTGVHDQMQFAMAHRHLANKKVQVANDKNINIVGTVVGLEAPNALVKVDGPGQTPTISVPIENITEL